MCPGNIALPVPSAPHNVDLAALNEAKDHPPQTQQAADLAPSDQPVHAVDADAQALAALLERLLAGDDTVRSTVAGEVASFVQSAGVSALQAHDLLQKLLTAANDTASPTARQGALLAIAELSKALAKHGEPYLVPQLDLVLEKLGDKEKPVREAAQAACKALVASVSPNAVRLVLPMLFAAMDAKRNWQVKAGALEALSSLAAAAPLQVSACLPEIVPVVSAAMVEVKPQVKKAAFQAMQDCCRVLGNRDVEPFVPVLVACIARPAEVPDCVHKLAATTFVQAVEAPTLSILIPLLVRGLRERATAVKRKTALIIDNMAKLVDNPADAAVFLPRLLPGLERVSQEVADPECRSVASRAHATLVRVGAEGQAKGDAAQQKIDIKLVHAAFQQEVAKASKATVPAPVLKYVAGVATGLVQTKEFSKTDWRQSVAEFLQPYVADTAEAEAIAESFRERCFEEARERVAGEEDAEEGEDLCNCEFSLAYGAKILLNNATLRLKKGKRYGLCGPNGVGKSTLMRAIANGQVDGFPPKDQLRTVYVEHDIDACDADLAVVEFVFADKALQEEGAAQPDHAEVERVLGSVGFTPAMQQTSVGALSGGWKMKLALARAMLMKADIFLLDEPTNHLDVNNVAWLQNYLCTLPNVTSLIVSHDSGFLDAVCTGIIHYEGRKLRNYKGNLSEFVKIRPEAQSYYKLEAATQKFVLPEPGFLEGIKSKDKAILKMGRVAFTYPGSDRQILKNITCQVALNSRVAVIGANGAGKSTMIKLLTGEMEPNEGLVWKHPNMRIAYVAQHAFHHIEKHLDMTPNQYIQWRYQIGEDRENLQKVDRTVTKDEEAKMAAQHKMEDGTKRVVEKLLGRRKLKKSYEYEVQWVGMTPQDNTWMTRDRLEEMGFGKMVNEVDVKEAARLGLHTKPLTTANVQKHLADLGIEPEFGTHSQMRGLSGGQKVKVVIAAAMWNNPHILILDEPTNYLDRESLGALAGAIKEYGGGVVMISHNREFTSTLCPETWNVAEGTMAIDGAPQQALENMKLEWKAQEETVDAFGNTVKIKQNKTLSRKEKKQREKARALRRKAGEEVFSDEDDE